MNPKDSPLLVFFSALLQKPIQSLSALIDGEELVRFFNSCSDTAETPKNSIKNPTLAPIQASSSDKKLKEEPKIDSSKVKENWSFVCDQLFNCFLSLNKNAEISIKKSAFFEKELNEENISHSLKGFLALFFLGVIERTGRNWEWMTKILGENVKGIEKYAKECVKELFVEQVKTNSESLEEVRRFSKTEIDILKMNLGQAQETKQADNKKMPSQNGKNLEVRIQKQFLDYLIIRKKELEDESEKTKKEATIMAGEYEDLKKKYQLLNEKNESANLSEEIISQQRKDIENFKQIISSLEQKIESLERDLKISQETARDYHSEKATILAKIDALKRDHDSLYKSGIAESSKNKINTSSKKSEKNINMEASVVVSHDEIQNYFVQHAIAVMNELNLAYAALKEKALSDSSKTLEIKNGKKE